MVNLSIIIISYNTKQLTIDCIRSLLDKSKTQLEEKEYEIILVDNNSEDGTVAEVKKLYEKSVIVIENKENTGFSKGNNIGAARAKGTYLLFLNSDTEVAKGDFDQAIAYFEENITVGILGGKIKNFDNTLQPSAGKFYTVSRTILLLLGAERLGALRYSPFSQTAVDWVSGAFMMTKRSLFDRIGRFDEHIFMYMEDMELCFRVKKAGYSVLFFPDIEVLHRSQGSSNRTFAILNIYKGILYFYKKHMPFYQQIIVRIVLKSKAAMLLLIGKITNNTYLSQTYEKAFHIS